MCQKLVSAIEKGVLARLQTNGFVYFLGGPTGGAKKHPFAPLSFGFAEALFRSNFAPTVIGEDHGHRVPEVFEPGTVRILTVPLPFKEYASWKSDRSHGYKVLGLNNANSGGLHCPVMCACLGHYSECRQAWLDNANHHILHHSAPVI